jgi:hypothetical protein
MAATKFGVEPRADGIDLDRVIVDPDYRRRIIDRLRAEAETRVPTQQPQPDPGGAGGRQ